MIDLHQLFIVALASHRRTLTLDAADYYTSKPLVIPSSFAVRGRGRGATRIVSECSESLFVLADEAGQTSRIEISGLSVEHSGTWLAEIRRAGAVSVRDLDATGLQSGIAIHDGTCIEVDGLDLRGFSQPGGIGVLIDGGNEHWIDDCVIEGLGNAPAAGIRIARSGGTYIDTVSIIRCGNGVLVDPEAGASVEWCSATNLKVDTSSEDGIRVAPGSGIVRGLSLDQCWSSSNGGHGIAVVGGESLVNGLSVSDSQILNNCGHGVYLEDGVESLTLSECRVAGNSRGKPGEHDGVRIASPDGRVAKVRVSGGSYGCADGLSGWQRYGIHVYGTLHELVIDGTPNLTGNDRGTLNLGASSPFIHIGPVMGITNTWLPVKTARIISPNLLPEDGNGAPHERCRLVGTGVVQTILHGWSGRVVTFLCAAGVAFAGGGNIATPLVCDRARRVTAEYDGAQWWLS